MRRVIEIPVAHIIPAREACLRAMGVTPGVAPGARTERLVADALDALRTEAQPRGIASDVSESEFAEIYQGEGDNAEPAPLPEIFPLADALVLFAVTVGAPLSGRITELFDAGDPALGAALDAVASEATVRAVARLELVLLDEARRVGAAYEDTRVLSYSPGYCGWGLTGQRALFRALGPEEIGISLTDSFLMEPLKSISGVAVMGPREIHDFADDFVFCSECRTRECRHRIRTLRSPQP